MGNTADDNKQIKVILHHKKDDTYTIPAVLDGATIKYVISGTAGTFECSFLSDENLHVEEGDVVQVYHGDDKIFYGYIFTVSNDKERQIKVTAYDQIRYLLNKDYFYYENKTAGELVQCLSADFGLNLGNIKDTKYKINQRRESNVEILSMIQYAIDATLMNTKELYVLYDDFNSLCLQTPADLEVPILLDKETAENYSFSSTIDKETYNSIKLITDEVTTDDTKSSKGTAITNGTHKIIYAPNNEAHADVENMKRWGLLRLVKEVKASDYSDGLDKVANQLLTLYNMPQKSLSVSGAFGDVRVRAGSLVYCDLELNNDNKTASKMLVTEVTHTFTSNSHKMDLTLKGGEFL